MSTTFLQKNKKNLLEHKKTSSIEESEVSHRVGRFGINYEK